MHLSKTTKTVSVVAIAIVASSIVAWTLLSPSYMEVQSATDISNSLFQYAKSTEIINFTDAQGSYGFLFGLEYNDTATVGQSSIVVVLVSLVSQHLNSGFIKGVGLHLQNAVVLVDGVQNSGTSVRSTMRPNIFIAYLTSIQIGSSKGSHTLSVRLIVSIIDVNYVGYIPSSEQAVTLNGTVNAV